MTVLLIVVPDYASHYFPMSAIAHRVVASGTEVVVATGPCLRDRVVADGFFWSELRMSRGSNTGVRQPRQRGDDLRPFLSSTRNQSSIGPSHGSEEISSKSAY